MTLLAGILALGTGLAYTLLGAIAAYELGRHSARRGFSHFGAAFVLMAFTCGPHYIVHAVHLLFEGDRATWPLTAVDAARRRAGLASSSCSASRRWPAGAATGSCAAIRRCCRRRRGCSRSCPASSSRARLAYTAREGASTLALAPNAVLFGAFLVVGALVRRTQAARRPLLGGWSLSGVAMAGVFPTCGASHLIAGLVSEPDLHTLLFDLPGVPASLFFLWVVHRVHSDSLADWNRRPLVGRAGPTSRRSPWAAPAGAES